MSMKAAGGSPAAQRNLYKQLKSISHAVVTRCRRLELLMEVHNDAMCVYLMALETGSVSFNAVDQNDVDVRAIFRRIAKFKLVDHMRKNRKRGALNNAQRYRDLEVKASQPLPEDQLIRYYLMARGIVLKRESKRDAEIWIRVVEKDHNALAVAEDLSLTDRRVYQVVERIRESLRRALQEVLP